MITIMRSVSALLLAGAGVCHAGNLDLRVMLSGEVAPGVYGQVQIGNDRPPPLVYAQPVLIEPPAYPPPPVYLHVPPGHAKHWRKHCREYDACDRPVYFVRSAEYDPGYQYRYRERELERAREQERERQEQREHWREHVRDHEHDRRWDEGDEHAYDHHDHHDDHDHRW